MMIKANLIDKIADGVNLSKQDIEKVIEQLIQTVKDSIERGEEIEIRDFACFRIKERPAYIGRNPKTGEMVQVPAKRVVKIIPSKNLIVEE